MGPRCVFTFIAVPPGILVSPLPLPVVPIVPANQQIVIIRHNHSIDKNLVIVIGESSGLQYPVLIPYDIDPDPAPTLDPGIDPVAWQCHDYEMAGAETTYHMNHRYSVVT